MLWYLEPETEIHTICAFCSGWGSGLGVGEELIEQGLNVNYIDNKGMTALMYCAEENMVEYAQLLINNNADISIKTEDGKNAKQIAEEMGSNEILELLGGE